MLYCLDFNAFFFVLLFSLNGCETFKRNNFNSKSKKTGEKLVCLKKIEKQWRDSSAG